MSLDSSASSTPLPGTIGGAADRPALLTAVAARGRLSPRMDMLRQHCLSSLRAHTLFIGLIALYVGLGWALSELAELPVPFVPDLYSANLLLFTATFVVLAGFISIIYVMVFVRPPQLTRFLVTALVDRVVFGPRLWAFLPVVLLLPMMTSTFTYFKVLIPYFRPYEMDRLFAEWDRTLHFGRDPWELLQPVLGHPVVTAIVNFNYHLWLFVLFGVVLWQGFSTSRPRLRMQFFITFVLMWILLGNVAATLLSSAGPVYYGRITGLADPFVPLMTYLHQAGQVAWVPALEVQEMLWKSYVSGDLGIGSGISAMPSLHVATSLSFALLGFAIDRRLGILLAAFAAAIFVGSVHLGWHYAIDGYVAAIGALAIWRSVGWLLERPAVIRLLWGDAAERPVTATDRLHRGA